MIKSMTGYGKAETSTSDKKICVEVRSLNSKQLDLSLKIPSKYRTLDPEFRALAGKKLQRGKVDIFLNIESTGGDNGVTVNRELFSNYYNQLSEISTQHGISCDDSVISAQIISSVLRMPDVVVNNNEEISDEEKKAAIGALTSALENIDKFRTSEGETLIADILKRVDKIENSVNEILPYEQKRVETIKKRILEGVEKIGVAIDSNRLEQEMIFYMEKLDITEEKVRLVNHCSYFKEVVNNEEGAGRKLGFISQEMGREINTLGSKANDSSIQKIVVGMKDELEKIKEQLLNIL